jgi:hypothetical protein
MMPSMMQNSGELADTSTSGHMMQRLANAEYWQYCNWLNKLPNVEAMNNHIRSKPIA